MATDLTKAVKRRTGFTATLEDGDTTRVLPVDVTLDAEAVTFTVPRHKKLTVRHLLADLLNTAGVSEEPTKPDYLEASLEARLMIDPRIPNDVKGIITDIARGLDREVELGEW
jgi:hypothetical protein